MSKKPPVIVGIGEVLWDRFPDADRLGGALANFAFHAGRPSRPPKVECIDAVGAGDAFAAALVTGLLRRDPLQAVADRANQINAYVASRQGAMPRLPRPLLTL